LFRSLPLAFKVCSATSSRSLEAQADTKRCVVASLIASGEAEVGFQQVSELIAAPGRDYVGPLPADI
jgi:hypothetical protein